MNDHSLQPKQSLLCTIMPSKTKESSQGITRHYIKRVVALSQSFIHKIGIMKNMARTLFVELKCCRNSIPPKQSLQNFQNLFLLNKLLRKNKDSFCVKYVDILQGLLCCRWHNNTLKGHLRKLQGVSEYQGITRHYIKRVLALS